MYKINHERTLSAGEKIGIALFIAGILHMALNESLLMSDMLLTGVGLACVIMSILEKQHD